MLTPHRIDYPPPLSRADERAAFAALVAARRARNTDEVQRLTALITEHNMRLVVHVATKIATAVGGDLDDLIQWGSFGLLIAIRKFDPSRGLKFSTYATNWISSKAKRGFLEDRPVRLPIHIHDRLYRIRRAIDRLESRGAVATIEAIYDELGGSVSLRAIERAMTARAETITLSMDMTYDESDETLANIIPSPCNVERAAEQRIDGDALRVVLYECLTEQMRTVIELRFGLRDGTIHTLEEAGRAIGVTRERARQIQALALDILRTSGQLRKMVG
jgi:RNA polymerase primary sigma factor